MLSFVLFCQKVLCSVFDKYGVMYEDSSLSVLELAPEDLTNYTIPPSVVTIKGGSESKSAFYRCRNCLKSIHFSEGSNLRTLEICAFTKCVLEGTVNMSYCKELLVISENSFSECKKIQRIVFPPNLQEISYGAFRSCESIINLFFPPSLKKLFGYHDTYLSPFISCFNLEKINWGENPNISIIGSNCFYGTGLKTLFIPRTVTSIGEGAFAMAKLENISVDPDNQKYSSNGALLMNKKQTAVYSSIFFSKELKKIEIPNGVTSISGQAFRGVNFSTIIISSTVREITSFTFAESYINTITLGENLSNLGPRLFANCGKLEYVNYETCASLSDYLFTGCRNLQELNIPMGVKSIGSGAFEGCTKIKLISIPSSVISVGAGCFSRINSTAVIKFDDGSPIKYDEGIIYSSDYNTIINFVRSESRTILIKSKVQVIGNNAFEGAEIDEIIFGNSTVITISNWALKSSKIKLITIPRSVSTIGRGAFEHTSFLTEINFESNSFDNGDYSNLTVIPQECFRYSKLISIIIPKTVLKIGQNCFTECQHLIDVSFNGDLIKEIGSGCFKSSSLPSINIPKSVDFIGRGSFEGSSITAVSFSGPPKLKIISDGAFLGCTQLLSVTFIEGIQGIGESAFEKCSSITSIRLCISLRNISTFGFKDCSSLKTVEIPDACKLELIEELAFDGCICLKEFDVSDKNVNFLSKEGVLYNKNVTRIILYLPASTQTFFKVPASIMEISAHAFHKAQLLEEVYIQDQSVQRIGFKAFYGCTRLSRLRLPAALSAVDSQAFGNCPSLKCGSVECENLDLIKSMLIEAMMPEEALHKCQTVVFTANANCNKIVPETLIMQLISHEDENESIYNFRMEAFS